MDIITTGVSATSTAKVKVISDYIKKVQCDFREKVNAHGIKYHNLFEFLQAKVKD